MSKDAIEKKLDWIISLLEGLPRKMAMEIFDQLPIGKVKIIEEKNQEKT